MKKTIILLTLLLTIGAFSLQAGSLNLKIGSFFPAMESDLWETNLENLAFDKQDMRGLYLGAEFEFFLGRYASFTLEAGHYDRELNTVYRDVEYEDGTPLYHDLSLRIMSMEAGIKFYLTGHSRSGNRRGKRRYSDDSGSFKPYIGGGVGLYAWKYMQGGDFLDYEDYSVSEGQADTETYTPGFNAKVGFVYRFQRSLGIALEAKYTYLKGDLSSLFEGFEKFDLSGLTVTAGLNLFLN
ncbi:MAG: hypothetical protein GY765_22500 [bacterium]|nr:hypothetical protein [bacterium]